MNAAFIHSAQGTHLPSVGCCSTTCLPTHCWALAPKFGKPSLLARCAPVQIVCHTHLPMKDHITFTDARGSLHSDILTFRSSLHPSSKLHHTPLPVLMASPTSRPFHGCTSTISLSQNCLSPTQLSLLLPNRPSYPSQCTYPQFNLNLLSHLDLQQTRPPGPVPRIDSPTHLPPSLA